MNEEIATAWIAEHQSQSNMTPGPAYRALNALVQNDPGAAVEVIGTIIKLDHSDFIMEVLAAGPLENLLTMHGEKLVEPIRVLAKNNEYFRQLLGGVWEGSIDDKVWAEIQGLSDGRW